MNKCGKFEIKNLNIITKWYIYVVVNHSTIIYYYIRYITPLFYSISKSHWSPSTHNYCVATQNTTKKNFLRLIVWAPAAACCRRRSPRFLRFAWVLRFITYIFYFCQLSPLLLLICLGQPRSRLGLCRYQQQGMQYVV
jgi:hypothetical protein